MKRTAAAITVMTMSLWAITGLAQDRNFAGTWAFDEARSAAARGWTGSTITIATNGSDGPTNAGGAPPVTVALDAASFTAGPDTYKIGGITTLTDKMRGGTVTFKTAWKDDKLVIDQVAGPDGPVISTTSWYLEGQSLVREYSRPSSDGSAPRAFKTYFKRLPASTAS